MSEDRSRTNAVLEETSDGLKVDKVKFVDVVRKLLHVGCFIVAAVVLRGGQTRHK